MLTRIYIDNFRCFVNFEYRPARKQLILGANGSGKSSFFDALLFLRQFAVMGISGEGYYIASQRTRWLNQAQQVFELEAVLDDLPYTYRLAIEPSTDPPFLKVISETVQCDGKPLVEFIDSEVRLYDDRFEHKVTYPFSADRSVLPTLTPESQRLTRFRLWLSGIYGFRLNPFNMSPRAEREDLAPNIDLSNLAAWYRHLLQADPAANHQMEESLRASIHSFRHLALLPVGENVRLLVAEFLDGAKRQVQFSLNQLSEGQRCLICLYAIVHFLLAKGHTVVLDEPDNFISLREIQPWLMTAEDAVDDANGQMIVISHHPEFMNQWAPSHGVQFVRDGTSPVRVEKFQGDPDTGLYPSELVARGWERE